MFITAFADAITGTVIRVVTGRLLTEDQIKRISSDAVGKYFADFFPTPKNEAEVSRQVQIAHQHIAEASHIISGLQGKLEVQAKQLEQIVKDIEDKKEIANHYSVLAQSNKQVFDAFRKEMEGGMRVQLRAELEKGKRARQVSSFIVWSATLVIGAALGEYFKPILEAARIWLGI